MMDEEPINRSPRMLESMEILRMPLGELELRVDRELDENPAMEYVKHDNEQSARLAALGCKFDVRVVQQDDGAFGIEVVPLVRQLRVRDEFRTQTETESTEPYDRKKIRDAQWFIEGVHQRNKTLHQSVEAIVERQPAFFRTGSDDDRVKLSAQAIADSTGLSLSTVTAAVQGKFVETSHGLVALDSLLEMPNAEVARGSDVCDAIQRLVDAEDKSAPLSDDQLASQLRLFGHDVARRAVTKFRKRLNIPSSRSRRRRS